MYITCAHVEIRASSNTQQEEIICNDDNDTTTMTNHHNENNNSYYVKNSNLYLRQSNAPNNVKGSISQGFKILMGPIIVRLVFESRRRNWAETIEKESLEIESIEAHWLRNYR